MFLILLEHLSVREHTHPEEDRSSAKRQKQLAFEASRAHENPLKEADESWGGTEGATCPATPVTKPFCSSAQIASRLRQYIVVNW